MIVESFEEIIKNFDLNYLENLIWLFFTYSFAGWFMESVGGILKVKKFVNRGFLIGPLCPVYGIGVVVITIFLSAYANDVVALFVLASVLCGVLEYLTSYIMEKLFNARWWDYNNRKFNINGRICLENICLFGIAGCAILCIINPFLLNLYSFIPIKLKHILTVIYVIAFIIDFCVSFKIISSFKNVTYESLDNTEEISEKVKDETEYRVMKAESDARAYIRKVTIKNTRKQRQKRYIRKQKNAYALSELTKFASEKRDLIIERIELEKAKIDEQIKQRKENIANKQKESKEYIDEKIQKVQADFEKMQKESKEKWDTRIKSIKNSSEEISKQVKDKFSSQSVLKRRLINAFPDLKINTEKIKEKKSKERDNK